MEPLSFPLASHKLGSLFVFHVLDSDVIIPPNLLVPTPFPHANWSPSPLTSVPETALNSLLPLHPHNPALVWGQELQIHMHTGGKQVRGATCN